MLIVLYYILINKIMHKGKNMSNISSASSASSSSASSSSSGNSSISLNRRRMALRALGQQLIGEIIQGSMIGGIQPERQQANAARSAETQMRAQAERRQEAQVNALIRAATERQRRYTELSAQADEMGIPVERIHAQTRAEVTSEALAQMASQINADTQSRMITRLQNEINAQEQTIRSQNDMTPPDRRQGRNEQES